MRQGKGPIDTSKLSENEFLRAEAEKAKSAMVRSLNSAKIALTHNTDPREVTRRHPWIAIASAAVAGFVAASVAVPSQEEQALRRLERIRRAMNPDPPAPVATETNGHAEKKPEKPSFASIILHEVIQVLKPILMTAITTSIKSGANPPPPPGDAPVDQTPPSPNATF